MPAACVALLAAMAAQMITAMPHASAVVDEPAHLTSGYLSLVQGDLIVNREHPPLIKALAALPLLMMRPVLPVEAAGSPPRSSEDFEFDYSRRFLYQSNDADRLLWVARLPIVALTLLTGIILFLWSRVLLPEIVPGIPVAPLAALTLFAFEPNLLAHGRLVTTDMGATLFALAAFACLERSFAGTTGKAARAASPAASRRWSVASGAALGLGLLSRFSTLLLVPLVIAAAALDRRRSRSVRAMNLVTALVIALVLVNIGYGFQGGLFPLAHAPIGGALKTQPLASWEASPVLRWMPIPLPRLYIEGLDLARHKNQVVEGPGYLNGHYSHEGFWSYFVQAIGMKTTLPMLGLALAGVGLALAGARSVARSVARTLAIWVVLPAAGLLLLVTASTRAQIGLRYVLPILPWLCIAGGLAAVRLIRAARAKGWLALAPLLVWHVWSALAIHPYHLAYFNEAAGGPDRGYLHLVDSNLDWGQDLIGVKQFMREKGLGRINLYYFGTADPAYYGIVRAVPAEPGYVAISATHLMGVYLPDRDYFAPFRPLRPVATIGHSILIYHVDEIPSSIQRR